MADPILAYFTATRWPCAAPSTHRTAAYTSAIARAGIPVHLIVASADRGFNGRDGDGDAVMRHEFGIDPPENMQVHVIRWPESQLFSSANYFLKKSEKLVNSLIKEVGVNVVMSRDTRALPTLARLKNKDVITTFDSHDFYMDISKREGIPNKRLLKFHELEKKFAPKLDGLVTLLETQAELYRENLNGVEILPALTGVDERRKPQKDILKHKTIGYLGSLVKKSGMEEILQSFANLNLPDWKLLFIGGRTPGEIGRVTDRAKELGIENQIEITGWLSVPEMRTKLDQVSIALLPLHDTYYNLYMTAPSKLFDYFVHSLPVIVSDLPSLREIAGDAVEYIKPCDSDSLTSTLNKLISDKNHTERLSDAVYTRTENLSWDQRGIKTAQFLKKLSNRNS
jgi:glycosyltransferase involved in cell wall biosynthesis